MPHAMTRCLRSDHWTTTLAFITVFSWFELGKKSLSESKYILFALFFAEDKFNDFYIGVGTAFDVENQANFEPTSYNVCWYQNTSVPAGKTWVFTCTEEITGRFVTIYFPTTKTQTLSLCEVQVTNSKILHLSQ